MRALDFPRLDTVAALKAAAEQAARITGAEGVAIAIGNAVAMCCCASVGNAPDVGVLVGPDSGLSGICMRTSELVQCDDTATDSRVDPQAGQRTNLRSVLIVPVVVDGRLQAMLQAVSSKPQAFNSQHRELLSRMAQGIATLLSDAVAERRPKPATTDHQASATNGEGAGKRVEAVASAPLTSAASGEDKTRASATPSAASPETVVPQETPALSEPGEQSSAVVAPKVPRAAGSQGVLSSAALWRSLSATTKAGIVVGVVVVLVLAWYLVGAGRSSSPAGTGSAPARQASTAQSSTLEPGTGRDAAAPEITIEQSSLSVGGEEAAPQVTGSAPQLTPGRLVRRVDPVYPASARAGGITGSVVLTALVTKEGKVTNVQFVRGPEALASPSIDAVRQWVYEPYRLGGAPVAVQTMIDIKFTPHRKP